MGKLTKKQKVNVLSRNKSNQRHCLHHSEHLGLEELWMGMGWEWVPLEEVYGDLISIWNNNLLRIKDVIKSQRVLATKSWSIKDDWAVENIFGPNVNDLREA